MARPLKEQLEAYMRRLSANLVRSGFLLEGEIKNIVAIDTKDLYNDIKTGQVSRSGYVLKISVGSDNIAYAKYVDRGVQGKIYQYHRRSGLSRPVVWVGVGMNYLERSVDSKASQILQILKSTKR